MVQIISHERPWSLKRESGKHFWQLIRREDMTCSQIKASLRDAGHPFKASSHKDELIQQHIRSQRGQINHERCVVPELRACCVRRGITTSREAKKLGYMDLVHSLDAANNGETFSRFLDLPAELRLRIFGVCFESFNTHRMPLAAPFPIPLAEMSSLLRQEVLSAYYSTCTFECNTITGIVSHPPWFHFCGGRSTPMLDFIQNGPVGRIPMPRKLNMDLVIKGIWEYACQNYGKSNFVRVRIDFGTDHKCAEALIDYERSKEGAEGGFEIIKIMLHDIMNDINTGAGGKRPMMSDLKAIVSIFQNPPRALRNLSTLERRYV